MTSYWFVYLQTAILSNETAQMLITKLHLPLKIVNIASVVMAISGLVLVLSITCYTLCKFIRAHMTGHKKMKVRHSLLFVNLDLV